MTTGARTAPPARARRTGFALGATAVLVGIVALFLEPMVLRTRVLGGLGSLALVLGGGLVVLLTAVLAPAAPRREPLDRREHPVRSRLVAGVLVLATVAAALAGSLLALPLLPLATVSVALALSPDAVRGWRWCLRAAGGCLVALPLVWVGTTVAVSTAVPEGLEAGMAGYVTLLGTAAAGVVLAVAALVGWSTERHRVRQAG